MPNLPPDEERTRASLGLIAMGAYEFVDEWRHGWPDSAYMHPSVIDHAGLAAALRDYCAEFGALTGVEVSFQAEGLGADAAGIGRVRDCEQAE